MPYKPLSAGFFTSWDAQSHKMMEQYAFQAEELFQQATKEAAQLAASVKGFDPSKPFRFEDYPQTRLRAQKFFNKLAGQLQSQVVDGQARAWTLSNTKNDALVDAIVKATALKKSDVGQYYQQNLQALSTFQKRKENGLGLSDRVWKYTTQFKNEIETGLDVGLGEGKSAADLARDLKKYLQQPDKLFRRVRDEKGQLHLSKAAKAYHPGQGVYRSSTKNAQRLSRTEVNMAYRTADADRWAQMDFILGVEVKTSRNHPEVDICDTLAGKYPKDFKFVGWHPQCRCYAIPIMAGEDDFDAMQMAILNGEDPGSIKAQGVITDLPPNFRAWVKENADKIAAAKNKPYFIRDNQHLLAPKPKPKPKEKEKAKAKKRALIKPAVKPKAKGFVPRNLEEYERLTGVKIKREFFQNLNKDIPLKIEINGGQKSYYLPSTKTVHLSDTKEFGKWYSEKLVYHEYGHAIDWDLGLRSRPEVQALMDKYRTIYSDRRNKKFTELSVIMHRDSLRAFKAGIKEEEYKILAAQDTLMSLNSKFGQGHEIEYFSNPELQRAEFIAHAFENKFIGNDAFKKYMPDLYEEMITMLDTILQTPK